MQLALCRAHQRCSRYACKNDGFAISSLLSAPAPPPTNKRIRNNCCPSDVAPKGEDKRIDGQDQRLEDQDRKLEQLQDLVQSMGETQRALGAEQSQARERAQEVDRVLNIVQNTEKVTPQIVASNLWQREPDLGIPFVGSQHLISRGAVEGVLRPLCEQCSIPVEEVDIQGAVGGLSKRWRVCFLRSSRCSQDAESRCSLVSWMCG